jgi:hypothetical protein
MRNTATLRLSVKVGLSANVIVAVTVPTPEVAFVNLPLVSMVPISEVHVTLAPSGREFTL